MSRLLSLLADNSCSGSQVNVHVDNYCQSTGLPTVAASSNELQTILQIFFGVLAALAVMFVVIGGLRYTLSGGEPEDMSKAKNTIIYALIGLLVAMFAEALVTFALGFVTQ